jgi:hypothetical protein
MNEVDRLRARAGTNETCREAIIAIQGALGALVTEG